MPIVSCFAAASALATLGVAGALLSGCAPTMETTGSTAGMEPIAGTEGPAMAATFRYLFANNGAASNTAATTYCVGIGTPPDLADPKPDLLAALSRNRPSVVPASACRRDQRATDAAGRPALIFNLRPVRCDDAESCEFEGGYYEGNLGASGGRYRARRVNGTWVVTPEGPQAVS